MIFNEHRALNGKHALLSPSSSSFLNYTDDGMLDNLEKRHYATRIGTALHEYAEQHIEYKIKMSTNKALKPEFLLYLLGRGIPENVIDVDYLFYNLAAYINDAIKFGMSPEVKLVIPDDISGNPYGDPPAFGTADAISFDNNLLRIHDLKTGTTPAHFDQLMCYASLFCLEYGRPLDFRPGDISVELRIYQANDVQILNPTVQDLTSCIDRIVYCSRYMVDHFKTPQVE